MKAKNYFFASDDFINMSILAVLNLSFSCLGTIIGFALQNNNILVPSISIFIMAATLFSIIIILEKKGFLGKKKRQNLDAFSDIITAIISVTSLLFLFSIGIYYGPAALIKAFMAIVTIGIVYVSIHLIYSFIKDSQKQALQVNGDHGV